MNLTSRFPNFSTLASLGGLNSCQALKAQPRPQEIGVTMPSD
jgi:hypothetical protein